MIGQFGIVKLYQTRTSIGIECAVKHKLFSSRCFISRFHVSTPSVFSTIPGWPRVQNVARPGPRTLFYDASATCRHTPAHARNGQFA